MTLKHRLPGKNKWKCDVCGQIDFWRDGWVAWASLADIDEIPLEDIPTCCSEECLTEFKQRIKDGRVSLLKVKNRGYTVSISGERRGY